MQFTTHAEFGRLEEAYRAYLEAWGAWIVEHHRGASPESERDLAATLLATRTEVARRLVSVDGSRLDSADAEALAVLRSCLPEYDALAEPLDGVAFGDGVGGGASTAVIAPAEAPSVARLRREAFDAWGAAMADIEVDGEHLDRLTVAGRLAREPDPRRRRALFASMEPAWRVLNGGDRAASVYGRLLASSAGTWARIGSPVDANAAALGIDPASVEPTLRRAMAAFRTVALPAELVEPWDYRHVTGSLSRRLDDLVGLDDLRAINDAHLRAIGADPTALRIGFDIHARPGRPVIPTAFTVARDIATRADDGSWTPATPWIFATYREGGLGNLEELVHESGHALHYAAIRQRPATFGWPPDQTAFVEAIADVVAWSTHEPAFLRHHLGAEVSVAESVAARYAGVMMDGAWTLFEIELHRHPDRSPNDAWAEIMERDLGVRGHPEWSWWAARGQLIDAPGYLANYALGAIVVAAVRARIRALRGDWSTGDPGWYGYLSRTLLQFGGSRSPRELLRAFLDGPLTAEALVEDLESGA